MEYYYELCGARICVQFKNVMHFQHGALTPYVTTPGPVNHCFIFELTPMLFPPMGERVHQDANGEVYRHGDQVTCYVGPVNNGHCKAYMR